MVLRILCVGFVGVAFASAATSRSVGSQASADSVGWKILDTVTVEPPDEGCCYSIKAYHLEVQAPVGTRQLPFLQLRPAQLPGRALLLRVVNRDQSIVLRRYSLAGHSLSLVARPPDYDSSYTWPEFLSARQLLVYTVPVPGVGTRVVVRRWPKWELVVQSRNIERCDDAMLGGVWNDDGRYVVWYPPHCTDSTAAIDSMPVPEP